MTDEEYDAQVARITPLVEKWKDKLWLGPWRFKHTFDRGYRDGDPQHEAVGAQVTPQWEYMTANFTWYTPVISILPDDELDEYVLHECFHVVVSEMSKGKKDPHEERVVTSLSRIIMELLK